MFVAFVFGVAGCATSLHEPVNLGAHKQEIRDYVKSGRYAEQLEDVATQANDWIEKRAARKAAGESLAVVLDLDETLFLNWSRLDASDFTYVREDWNRWVAEAAAPAIELADPDSVELRIRLSGAGAALVRPGQPLSVISHADRAHPLATRVLSVSPRGDAAGGRGAVEARVRLARSDAWRPGVTGEGSVRVRESTLLGAFWWEVRSRLRTDLLL